MVPRNSYELGRFFTIFLAWFLESDRVSILLAVFFSVFVAAATLNRGFVAQESDRLDVEELIEMLELENPNPTPCAAFETGSSPIAGRWQ